MNEQQKDEKIIEELKDPRVVIHLLSILAAELSRTEVRRPMRHFVLAIDRAIDIIRDNQTKKK